MFYRKTELRLFNVGNEGDYGGAVMVRDRSILFASNLNISANAAKYGGGLYFFSSASAAVSNCIFRNNSALYSGGGILLHHYSGLLLSNSVINRISAFFRFF